MNNNNNNRIEYIGRGGGVIIIYVPWPSWEHRQCIKRCKWSQ